MQAESTPSVASANGAPARRLSVLVADDEPLVVRAIQRVLERRGHEVRTAADAYGALDLLDDRSFDAVFVDDRMPGGGRCVLDRLRERGFPGTAVLMSGGRLVDGEDLGEAVQWLQKPFPFPAVVSLVENGHA
jgi:two-component system response regulator VanR